MNMKKQFEKSLQANARHNELMKLKTKKRANARVIDFNVKQDIDFLKNALRFDYKVENVLYATKNGIEFTQKLHELDNRYDVPVSVANQFFNEHFKLNEDFRNMLNNTDFEL